LNLQFKLRLAKDERFHVVSEKKEWIDWFTIHQRLHVRILRARRYNDLRIISAYSPGIFSWKIFQKLPINLK
jgi:hypothetical protein